MAKADLTQMPELREIRMNPVVPTESVLIATAKSRRPKKEEAPAPRDTREHVAECPFCVGNEAKTPPEISRVEDGAGGWSLRWIPNMFPILGDESEEEGFSMGLQRALDGYGRHEVLVDNVRHGTTVSDWSVAETALALRAYRNRMGELYRSNPRFEYVLPFKNFGPAAGGSIPHTHSQIIALPVVPQNIQEELAGAEAYRAKTGRCVFCALLDEALSFEATLYDKDTGKIRRKVAMGQYVVERGEHFVALKPFASKYEWEVHVLPLEHEALFHEMSEEKIEDLARVMRNALRRIEAATGGAQFNYFLHAAPPNRDGAKDFYHWHWEICPRVAIPNGFELGSGLAVNTVSPEWAAEKLREAEIPKGDA